MYENGTGYVWCMVHGIYLNSGLVGSLSKCTQRCENYVQHTLCEGRQGCDGRVLDANKVFKLQ